MQVDLFESSTLRIPEWVELKRFPLDPALPQSAWQSDVVCALAVGPIDLAAGDIIEAALTHELDNENAGHPGYNIHGVQHEYGWAMASTAVRFSPTINPNAGTYVAFPQEQNWDWRVHHLGVNRVGRLKIPANYPAAYVYDKIYFKAGTYVASFAPAEPPPPERRRLQINGGNYPRLSVLRFRQA